MYVYKGDPDSDSSKAAFFCDVSPLLLGYRKGTYPDALNILSLSQLVVWYFTFQQAGTDLGLDF